MLNWNTIYRILTEFLFVLAISFAFQWFYNDTTIKYVSYKRLLNSKEERALKRIADQLVGNGKGILAADESIGTIGKRFAEVGLENTEENRRKYRQMLFTTPKLGEHISGIILFEETFYQKNDDGLLFVDIIRNQGILIGIKLDQGLQALGSSSQETITKGLSGLAEKAAEFKKGGCEFAKWRSVYHIGPGHPSAEAVYRNAKSLARFAAICQKAGLVPIIEPEVLSDGDHSIFQAQLVQEKVLSYVYKALNDYNVYLEGTLLKASMVYSGRSSIHKNTPEEIGEATVVTLRRTVPVAVPGIVFLSGGQLEEEATKNLGAINMVAGVKPWKLTFSYGRALQTSALKAWNGTDVIAGQHAFYERAMLNCLVVLGRSK
ncbi:hypothetical protein AB6A40_003447 [Gnathostoma spinigerum]|uniref:Fructose-bisphosphate aldolase n=1 Tax=Gnathostoma spinigerum TaxID=75299 RepID=A0ABD6EIE9_9BILA